MSTTISQQLSRCDRFIVQHTPIQKSETVITTVNAIAAIALQCLLYCIGSQICRKWPQSWIAVGLSVFSSHPITSIAPKNSKLWTAIGIFSEWALQFSLANSVVNVLSNRFSSQKNDSFYDRASYLNIYEKMLNVADSEIFAVCPADGPLDQYISISADMIAKNKGVDRGAILNQQNKNGNTWLHWAVSQGNASLFEKLLDMGLDLSIGPPDSVSRQRGNFPGTRMCFRPLDEALIDGKAECLKVAFRKHLSSNYQLLNEISLKSFINTLSEHDENQNPITNFRADLIKLFKKDPRARQFLKEKIDQLTPFNEDKSLQVVAKHFVPSPSLLDSLYRESAPTDATFD